MAEGGRRPGAESCLGSLRGGEQEVGATYVQGRVSGNGLCLLRVVMEYKIMRIIGNCVGGAALSCAILLWSAPPATAQYVEEYCQILDRLDEPIWQAYAGVVGKSRVEGFRDTGMIEAGGHFGLLYFRTGFGEFDLRAAIDSVFFTRSADIDLPHHVSAARLDLRYVMRLQDGYALRLGFEPGLYSEIEHASTDHLFYPFSLHGIRAFTPELSGLAGLNFYPGFDRLVDPRVGVRWAPSDYLMFDVFYPQTEIVFRPNFDWALRAGVEFREYLEYHLKNTDDRRRLMMDETRIYLGVDRLITQDLQWMVRIGRLVNRSIDFRRFEQEKDLDDAYFVRIGIGGLI